MSSLYPELPEVGRVEAQALIDKFKASMRKAAEEVLAELYTDVAVYIESDSWVNYRNQLVLAMCDYGNRHSHCDYDFRAIRQAIYAEHRDEINKDLDRDNLKRIAELEATIKSYQEMHKY